MPRAKGSTVSRYHIMMTPAAMMPPASAIISRAASAVASKRIRRLRREASISRSSGAYPPSIARGTTAFSPAGAAAGTVADKRASAATVGS